MANLQFLSLLKLRVCHFIDDIEKVLYRLTFYLSYAAIDSAFRLFTILIINFLFFYNEFQFKMVAPEGLVAVKIFVEIFNDLILLNYGNDILPEQWSNLTSNQASF